MALANHYVSPGFEALSEDAELIRDSEARYAAARKAAYDWPSGGLRASLSVLTVLGNETTLHERTVQQMDFAPRVSRYAVRAYDNDDLLALEVAE